jgi:hypothetical protein
MLKPDIEYTVGRQHFKPMFAATSYVWIYAAADAKDAAKFLGKPNQPEHVLILDRSQMWDCSPVAGCQSHYEFRNTVSMLKSSRKVNIGMRELPCPYPCCNFANFWDFEGRPCLNEKDIVGPVKLALLKSKVLVPREELVAPETVAVAIVAAVADMTVAVSIVSDTLEGILSAFTEVCGQSSIVALEPGSSVSVVPVNLTVVEIVSPVATTTRSGRVRTVPRGELNMCWCGCGEHHSGTMVRCRADGCNRLVNPHCSNCSATWKCVNHRLQYINTQDVETADVVESESEDDDDELMALPGGFDEHDDSADSQDENSVDNEMQGSDDDICYDS